MIFIEENVMSGERYNRRLTVSDWRYSAAALGLIRFFQFKHIPHYYKKRDLYYRYEDIWKDGDDSDYLDFAEEYFRECFHHRMVEDKLKEEPDEKNKKEVNEKLSGNTVMKKVFKGIKYDGTNKDEIRRLIGEHRREIVRETFRNGRRLYQKFANQTKMGTESGEICRLLGHYVDTGRKTRSISFGFDKNARSYADALEFDFIPFAFSKGAESVFLNSNLEIGSILNANMEFNSSILNPEQWRGYFYNYTKGEKFIDYNVEIIKKGMENDEDKNDYYSSLHLLEEARNIFQDLHAMKGEQDPVGKALKVRIKLNENYYINIMDEVTDSILNLCDLDYLIDTLLKLGNQNFVTAMMIKINAIIYLHLNRLEEGMEQEKYLRGSLGAAYGVMEKLKGSGNVNKIKSYRHKLTSALVANDYDRFIEIMLQLSSYTDTSFSFMHPLIADFKSNKNLAYSFVNALIESEYKDGKEQK